MRLLQLMFLCTFVIYLLSIAISEHSYGVNALEGKHKGVGKVKCKEQVDEALRKYFDKDAEDDDDDDDDDDDETHEKNDESNENDNAESGKVKSDEDEEEEDKDDDDDDNDEVHEEGDDDDDDENDSVDHKESKNDDNDDDDDEEKTEEEEEEDDTSQQNAVKVTSKLKEIPSDEVDDQDGNEDNADNENESINEADSKSNDDIKESQNDDNVAEQKDDDDGDDEPEVELDEEELLKRQHHQKRSRTHIDDILRVYEIGSQDDNLEQNLILSIFRDLKRIHEQTVKPLETIYKYRQITTRLITDAEIFSKPMILFLGGKSTGKSSLVNYLLGIDDTPWEIKIGAAAQTKFTILSYGENYTHLSPIELSADNTFSSLQRFGEQFINDYIDAHRLPINILQKMTIVDSPGLIDLFPMNTAKQTIDNDVYQWFIDRSDVIYIVIDVSQLHLSSSLRVLLDQLKGREIRFVISKADIASHSQIISMIGQLLWVLSPIMSAERPPMVYALTTLPQDSFDEFLDTQESAWLRDLSTQLAGISRIESHIAEVRRHAVRVRNHAKLVDCYLSTYYKNKGLFTFGDSSRKLAADISENPHQYRIYSGAFIGQLQNVSRYDLPDPGVYREFFRSNPLIDFKPLTSTCSYFRGCPIDKLDIAIAYDLPELVGKYKKLTKAKLDQN